MKNFSDMMRGHAESVVSQIAQDQMGIVESYDPSSAAVKVLIQPDGVLSGWIPLGVGAAGGTTFNIVPNIGDQVMIHNVQGDGENYVVSHSVHSNTDVPPNATATGQPAQAGDFHMKNSAGAEVYIPAGSNTIHLSGAVMIQGNVSIIGNLTVTGTITAGSGGADSVTLQAHTHKGVQTGSGTSAGPTAGT